MLQKFFTTTAVSNFIKALLQSTPMPKYRTVRDGDKIYEGFVYVYGVSLIQCTKSGIIGAKENPAEYKLLANALDSSGDGSGSYFLGKEYLGRTDHVHSLNSYYDEDTHEALGEYLRCYRDIRGIDLMPFYNCFSYRVATDFILDSSSTDGYKLANNDRYKLLLVPIKYNKEYTVCIDSQASVQMMPVIYHNGFILRDGVEYVGKGMRLTADGVEYVGKPAFMPMTSFFQPIHAKVEMKDEFNKTQYINERNLYLAIQLDDSNQSSILVLEGNYNRNPVMSIGENAPAVSAPSLMNMNGGEIYAFSDRLVEYLLKNVIDSDDTIDENTLRIQAAMKTLYDYDDRLDGVYDNKLRSKVFAEYMSDKNNNYSKYDINGYADKDVEGWLMLRNGK